jgi:phosphoribosylformimino-5-aminoimidazole carboxamide ribotide isomerase
MVDAGITNIDRAEKLLDSGVSKLIVGTETLQTTAFVEEAVKRFGGDHVIISLDMKNGILLTKDGFDWSGDPLSLVQKFEDMGVEGVIVLDLARVGSGLGVDTALIEELIEETMVDVYVGGGVRGMADLVELRSLGVEGVLVATALHNGKISIEDLKKEGFL